MRKLRKWLHLLLVICLIAGSILPYLPAMKLTVSAQETEGSGSGDGTGSEGSGGEGTNPAGNVFYVDGVVGSDDADGLAKGTAFKTLAEAYTAIQAKQADSSGSAETYYIVICGNVDASDSGLTSYSTIEGANYDSYLMLPVHSGEVVITSKIGEEDYTQKASLSFGSGKSYMLQGATTFENINISSHAYAMYANFHNLTLGDGITGKSTTYYPARTVYLGFRRTKGLSYNNDNSKASAFVMDSGKLYMFYAGTYSYTSSYSNMSVTMNGGDIDTLYGTGNVNSGVQSKVEITINGGKVNNCYGVGNRANVGGSGVTITIKKDATVGTVSAVEPADGNKVAQLNGPATLNLVGYDVSTAIPGTISDFDYLGLINSTALQGAIDKVTLDESATEDVVIKLFNDIVSNENLVVSEGITLDLNGKALTASSMFNCGGNIVDNSDDKTGVLKVANENCVLSATNSQMPVYDSTKNGYVFVTIKDQNDGGTVLENSFKLIFRPSFGTDETAKNTLLANGGAAAGISIGIRLDWTVEDVAKSHALVYGKDAEGVDMVATVYDQDMAFYINALGTAGFTNLKVTPYIESTTGVVWNGATISANSN